MTNFDAVKSMTVEQFSEWLCNTVENCFMRGLVALNYKEVLADWMADYNGWLEEYTFWRGLVNEDETIHPCHYYEDFIRLLKSRGDTSLQERYRESGWLESEVDAS